MPIDEYLSKITSLLAAKQIARAAADSVIQTYPYASTLLYHFLDNSGETVQIPIEYIESSTEVAPYIVQVKNILDAHYNKFVDSGNTIEYGMMNVISYYGSSTNTDWRLGINACELWGKLQITNATTKQYTICIRDYYDWDANNMEEFFDVAATVLNEMHYAGIAKDFTVVGIITYSN